MGNWERNRHGLLQLQVESYEEILTPDMQFMVLQAFLISLSLYCTVQFLIYQNCRNLMLFYRILLRNYADSYKPGKE